MFDLKRWVSWRRPAYRLRTSYRTLRVEVLEDRTTPTLFVPSQIRHAYGFDQPVNGVNLTGAGQTIAIIDAYYDSHAASDLHTFDSNYGIADPIFNPLGQTGGSSTGPTFSQVSQTGGSPTGLSQNSGWAGETALDIEWAHAIAPGANILLVEASSSSTSNLNAAVDFARRLTGVSVVSMSWGGGESSGETSASSNNHYTTPSGHAGVAFFASSGDTGGVVIYPSASPNVVSVGGTSLTLNGDGSYASESAWSSGGGGASAYVTKPSYQTAYSGTMRGTPDVSYDSDPNTGFSVYNNGWEQVGGTSAASPQWAALVALADQGRALAGYSTSTANFEGYDPTNINPSEPQLLPALYSLPASDFHDVTSGSVGNGGNSHAATTGYDLATGLGTPKAQLVIADLIKYGSVGPAVTGQPVDSTVDAGVTAVFTVSASGSPAPTVQWQISTNGGLTWTNINGATSTNYTRSTTSADDGDEFRAVFTNIAGTATTQAATLTVNGAPVITTQPVSQSVALGGTVTFTAAATGSPAPTVQWQVSTDGGATFTNISGATATTYSFTPTAADSGSLFRAVFTNSAGSATSAAASVSFTGAVTVASLQVNDGSAQRSMVQSITITFSGPVTFAGGDAAAAFQLAHLTNGKFVVLSAAVSMNASGQSVVTLTFSGDETDPATASNPMPSLADGLYQLTILAANVTDSSGLALDGNGDGTAGDNYVSGPDTAGGNGPHLYRLFGDVNGDGVINAFDFFRFRTAFGFASNDPAYQAYFDVDGNGVINSFDFAQFRSRYGVSLFGA